MVVQDASAAGELDALREVVAALSARIDDPDLRADSLLVQRLLGAAVRLYAASVEAGGLIAPFPAGEPGEPTATEVCLAASQMLDAVSVEVFELALWKSWTAARVGSGAEGS